MKASQVGDVNTVKMLVGAGASLKIKAKVIYVLVTIANQVGLLWVERWFVREGWGGFQSHPLPFPYSTHNIL